MCAELRMIDAGVLPPPPPGAQGTMSAAEQGDITGQALGTLQALEAALARMEVQRLLSGPYDDRHAAHPPSAAKAGRKARAPAVAPQGAGRRRLGFWKGQPQQLCEPGLLVCALVQGRAADHHGGRRRRRRHGLVSRPACLRFLLGSASLAGAPALARPSSASEPGRHTRCAALAVHSPCWGAMRRAEMLERMYLR